MLFAEALLDEVALEELRGVPGLRVANQRHRVRIVFFLALAAVLLMRSLARYGLNDVIFEVVVFGEAKHVIIDVEVVVTINYLWQGWFIVSLTHKRFLATRRFLGGGNVSKAALSEAVGNGVPLNLLPALSYEAYRV